MRRGPGAVPRDLTIPVIILTIARINLTIISGVFGDEDAAGYPRIRSSPVYFSAG